MFVSVVMPTFNTAPLFLKSAIDSILNQTHKDFEFIIIDDGSKDFSNFKYIQENFEDERLILVKNEVNLGVARSLNRGLLMAKGDLIFRMDSDDISLPNRLEKMIEFMENNPEINIAGSFARTFGKRNFIVKLPTNDNEIKIEMLFNNPLCHPTVVMRGDFVRKQKISYPFDTSNEDYNLWVDLTKDTNIHFANSPLVLLKYRIHSSQVTVKNFEKLKSDSKIVIRKALFLFGIHDIDESAMDDYIKAIYSMENLGKHELTSIIRIFDIIADKALQDKTYESKTLFRSLSQKFKKVIVIQFFRFFNPITWENKPIWFVKKTGKRVLDLAFSLSQFGGRILTNIQKKRKTHNTI